jgi:thiol-disulfide isomerase/thioredoxin
VHETPEALPDVAFEDGAGASRTLAEYSGKVLLLNLWATWCVPCRKEMPTLDRLQAKIGGAEFEVVALSVDRAGSEAVKKFFQEIGIENLAVNIDPSSKVLRTLGAFGLPTTLLIDRQGREIGRLVGPAEWDTAEMVALIRNYIDED